MTEPNKALPNSELAFQVAKIWPHREHEANILLSQFCKIGWHRWRRLDLTELVPGRDIRHCFWCSRLEIDGIVFDV